MRQMAVYGCRFLPSNQATAVNDTRGINDISGDFVYYTLRGKIFDPVV
jgi:hypothetical protein